MRNYALADRARFYNEGPFGQAYPDSQLRASTRWLQGQWVLGNNYRGSGLYGSYPPSYLDRITTVFPDASRVLHVFSGSLPQAATRTCVTLDLRVAPQVVPGVQGSVLALPFLPASFDISYADPPYTPLDAARYDTPMADRRKTLYELHRVIEPGGFLVWLDTMPPMYRKEYWWWCGAIAMWRSSNHRIRGVHIFRRVSPLGEEIHYDDETQPGLGARPADCEAAREDSARHSCGEGGQAADPTPALRGGDAAYGWA